MSLVVHVVTKRVVFTGTDIVDASLADAKTDALGAILRPISKDGDTITYDVGALVDTQTASANIKYTLRRIEIKGDESIEYTGVFAGVKDIATNPVTLEDGTQVLDVLMINEQAD